MGALTGVLTNQADTIDPRWVLLQLDSCFIHGYRIWMLYKDVCRENTTTLVGVLRARELGIISISVLHHAIDNYGRGLDVQATLEEVREQLPDFSTAG